MIWDIRLSLYETRIWARTRSFLKLSDFEESEFPTSFLRFHNNLHVHYLFPREHFEIRFSEAFPVLRHYSGTLQVI